MSRQLGSVEEIIHDAILARQEERRDLHSELRERAERMRDKINTPAIGQFRRVGAVMEAYKELQLRLERIRKAIEAERNGSTKPPTNGDP